MDDYTYAEEDVLVEDEYSPYEQETEPSTSTWSYDMLNPKIYIDYMMEFIATYGWLVLFATILGVYLANRYRSYFKQLLQKWEDAEHHKDPDKALARMEEVQRAREAQQRRLQEASQRAREEQLEQEARKRAENVERLQKYGTAAGQRLGHGDDDYMPLSSTASTSSYRPPKRSGCSGGGCGR